MSGVVAHANDGACILVFAVYAVAFGPSGSHPEYERRRKSLEEAYEDSKRAIGGLLEIINSSSKSR